MMLKRNRKTLLCVAAALALGAGLVWFLQTRQPAYHGKPLVEWLRKIDYNNPDEPMKPESREAAAAVRAMGTKALPHLLRMLQAWDSPLKLRLVELARKQRFIRVRFTQAVLSHHYAGNGLRALGPQAEPAIPALKGYFFGMDNRRADIAAEVLGEIGPAAFPVLRPALTNSSTQVRLRALGGLAYFALANHPDQVIPILKEVAVRGPDDLMKLFAAVRLAKLGQEEELIVPVLVEGMQRHRNDTRMEAINALLRFPARAREHIAIIRRLAQDTKDRVGMFAAQRALKQIEEWGSPKTD